MVTNVNGNYAVNPYAYNNATGTAYSTNQNADTSYLAQTGQDTVSFSGAYQQEKTESGGKKILKAGLIIGGIALATTTVIAAARGGKINGEGAKLFQNIKTGFKSIFTKAGRAQYADVVNKAKDKLDDTIKGLPFFGDKPIKAGASKDAAGSKVIVDKYGTTITDFGNNTFLVDNGYAQKFYDCSAELAAETSSEVAKTVKEAQTLIKVLKQDPSDKATYRKILNLIHPDNAVKYGGSVEKAFQNLAAEATTIFEKTK